MEGEEHKQKHRCGRNLIGTEADLTGVEFSYLGGWGETDGRRRGRQLTFIVVLQRTCDKILSGNTALSENAAWCVVEVGTPLVGRKPVLNFPVTHCGTFGSLTGLPLDLDQSLTIWFTLG